MKFKTRFIIFALFIILSIPAKNLYALDFWALLKYAPTWGLSSQNNPNSSAGPMGVTLGIQPIDLIAIDLTLAGRVAMGNNTNGNYFDLKPYILLQSDIGNSMLSIMPYVGVGPAFYFGTSDNAAKNSIGAAVKLGLRLQLAKYLLLGVGGEYFYHKNASSVHNFSVVVEAGVIFD